MMKVEISIVIPVYNGEKYLSKCVSSIQNQTYKEYEVLFVLNGCTDNSELVCKHVVEEDDRFVLLKSCKGASNARNYGIKHAKGDYVCFVDIDDYLEENYLQSMLNTMKQHKAKCVICGYNVLAEDGNVIDNRMLPFQHAVKVEETNDFINMYCLDLINPLWNKIYLRSAISSYMNSNYVIGEDLDFNLRYFQKGKDIWYLPQCLYNYVVYNNNQYKKYHVKRFETLIEIQKSLLQYINSLDCEFKLKKNKDLSNKLVSELVFCVCEYLMVDKRYDKVFWAEIITTLQTNEIINADVSRFDLQVFLCLVKMKCSFLVYTYGRIRNVIRSIVK